MKARITALTLLLALAFTSCGGSGSAETTVSAPDTTAAPEETSPYVADELPELNFDGEAIRFAVQTNCLDEYFIGESTGDVVDDAIYRANLNVEARLNAELEYIAYTYNSFADKDSFMASIANSVLAGDDAFDAIFATAFTAGFMVQGLLENLADKPYLDLEKPWWSADMIEQSTVNGVLPFITGDISLGKTKGMMCMFFNKGIHSDYKMEDLYTLVDSGKWTVDKLGELAATAYSDLNGNTVVDEADRLGLVFNGGNTYVGFLDSCKLEVLRRSGDSLEFVFDNERNTNVIQRLVEIISSNDGIIYYGKDDSDRYLAEEFLFKQGNVLFTGGWVHCATSFRDLDFEYGILPYPKFDESQESYASTVLNFYSTYALPVTCSKPEQTCAALEALGSEFYRTVTPAYFETTLKVKYSNDNETSRMFDLLRETSGFNIGLNYTNALDYIADQLKSALQNEDPNWSSRIAAKKSSVEAKIEALINAYAEMAAK